MKDVYKRQQQNRARDNNLEEWRYIQGLLDKIRSTGMGGISADDPAAIEKLQKKLDGLERSQLIMKEVNAYYRKHGKLDGCALLVPDPVSYTHLDVYKRQVCMVSLIPEFFILSNLSPPQTASFRFHFHCTGFRKVVAALITSGRQQLF